jgi:hypothetical protein
MNRLILIGNGFDLAHGMKTSYNDFIHDYIKTFFEKANIYGGHDDILMKIIKNNSFNDFYEEPKTFTDFKQYLNTPSLSGITSGGHYGREESHPRKKYSWTIKNTFFKKLVEECCDLNWVDIENEYYTELLEILNNNGQDTKTKIDKLNELNADFGFLISILHEYFSKLPSPKFDINILDVFMKPISNSEITISSTESTHDLESMMILNFNYTNTHELYAPHFKSIYKGNIESNYIHGKINDLQNPIIFGFGDEIDDNYKKIEKDKADGFLKYVKTFAYLRTPKYRRLLNFIELAPSQIFILGHSCGLSDRTLLKMIFEHENCLSIKIFFHQKENSNNFTELTQAISRNFSDNGLMRKKVVDLTLSRPMPQSKI